VKGHDLNPTPEIFAPEQLYTTPRIAEALEIATTSLSYTRSEIFLDQLFLDEDFRLHCQGHLYRVTEKAFGDLCKLVKLPVSFALGIPTDLVATIIARLKSLHHQSIVAIHRDTTVVGLVDPCKWSHSRGRTSGPYYHPVTSSQLLQLLADLPLDQYEISRVTLADAGLQVELLDGATAIEPVVGDITRLGLVISSSETGGPLPQARGYTLRLVCTNGATVPTTCGVVYCSSDWRVRLERRLAAFTVALRNLTIDVHALTQVYTRLVATPLMDDVFYELYRQTRYVYRYTRQSEQHTDSALGVTPETRRHLIARVRQRQAAWRRRRHAALLTPQPTALAAWQVFNSLTAHACQETTLPRRAALERLAGHFLQLELPRFCRELYSCTLSGMLSC
jgi:hypothetical protein